MIDAITREVLGLDLAALLAPKAKHSVGNELTHRFPLIVEAMARARLAVTAPPFHFSGV